MTSSSTSPIPGHDAALAAAYVLVDEIQQTGSHQRVERDLGTVAGRGWPQVETVLHFAGVIAGRDSGDVAAIGRHSQGMRRAAEESQRLPLIALTIAADAFTGMSQVHRSGSRVSLDRAYGDVAQAVALLEEDLSASEAGQGPLASASARDGAPLHRAAAYIECGICYSVRSLWEIEEDMYLLAAKSLDVELDPVWWPVRDVQRRVIHTNRLDSTAVWASALLELGDRQGAREHADAVTRLAWDRDLIDLGGFTPGADAVASLLSALAGQPARGPARELIGRITGMGQADSRGFILLGQAIRASDGADPHGAAALAEEALAELSADLYPQLRGVAMHLVARRDPLPLTVQEYLETLTSSRWQDRLAMLGLAEARLQAERAIRENTRLTQHAHADELTGLANRRAYNAAVARLSSGPADDVVSVLLMDVDFFKEVNDTFGHAIGDEVLQGIGTILRRATRATDLAARLGGDEFVVLFPSDLAAGTRVAHEVLDAVTRHSWAAVAPGLTVSLSLGVASGPAAQLDQTLRRADEQLYAAKAAGRGRVRW